ncbi:amino acid adenylation domain-containing protein [Paenibacillus sp. 5J-6]|uniref:Amino acid adenylation domain-containing protein n=1 Tax=Paenibacillus silvestris TaxID=2606219 RepID=A0A6L8URF7_9BACL|nr:non-ribosomal peptide synthase/polyketide synthase [Paenibacillus silvestris]MZQ80588.1 amino acid adenylation domain-containing protein [Paenibacillus silvestris]
MSDFKRKFDGLSPENKAHVIELMKKKARAELEASIPVQSRDSNEFPLSFQQQRLWLLNEMESGNPFYNVPSSFRLKGELHLNALQKSLNEMSKRHEILRTRFVVGEGGQPVQQVAPLYAMTLDIIDLTHVEQHEAQHEAHRCIREQCLRPFDLKEVPWRVALVKLNEIESILVLNMHHTIFDGWSLQVFMQELLTIYDAFAKGLPSPLAGQTIQYGDYACWQRQLYQEEALREQFVYWEQKLQHVPVVELPGDHPRPAVQTFAGACHTIIVPKPLYDSLRELSRSEGSTLFAVLLCAFNLLLYRYTSQEDITVGTPVLGRNRKELEGLIGVFMNILVLRTDLTGNPSFQTLLHKVRSEALDAFSNQDVPFDSLVARLQPSRSLSHSPLFQIMFALHSFLPAMKLPGLELDYMHLDSGTSKYDLSLEIYERSEGMLCNFEYNTDIFDAERIERMGSHFYALLESLVANPAQRIMDWDSAELLSEQEKKQILEQFNDTKVEFPQGVSIHQLFEEQTARTPERLAVIHEHTQLTYRELNERVNRLAWTLRQKGIGANDVVGVCAERSPKMIVGILAILKAGGAYVPMTPDLPEGRLAYMLADSGAKLVLTERRLAEKLGSVAPDILCLDEESTYAEDSANLPETADGINDRALAYIIYTSGSTGQPKGVMVEHASVVNLLYALQVEYPLLPEDRFLLKTTFTFDVSVPELFGGFLTGAALVILPDGQEKDPEAIAHTIREHNVTHINFVPSMLRAFLQMQPGGSMSGLKYVFAAGEALAPDLVQSFYRQMDGAELINIYGPTEGTVYATGERLRADTSVVRVPIGRPLSNVRAYVIDTAGHLQPVGIAGELCLAGAGLARGYVNQPELTAEKFTRSLTTGERMYCTGDLVRWLPDGSIEYLGRMDHQVKIRGYRIELGEIEAALLQLEAVREATVIDREEGGERILCAYVTASRELTVSGLRAELSQSLPSYMIPAAFVQLERLPLTTSGKIDRKALPAPDKSSLSTGVTYVAPVTPLQTELAGIWQDVLGVKQVGIHDNFFDLGGHSLKATLLVSRMHKQLDIQVPLRDVFRYPTIEALAAAMQEMQASAYTAIKPAEPREAYPVTSQQKRLYVLQQLEGAETSYNMPAVLEVQGSIDRQRFEQALNALVARHEALRTSFELVGGEAVQRIHPTVELSVRYMQASEEEVAEQIAGFVRAFDISQAPLMRVGMMTLTEDRHLLLFDMHHIISDGMTLNVLIGDWLRLYEGQTLSPLKLQYKDYACWQQELVEQGALQKQEAYWLEQLSGELPLLDVPADFARPSIRSFEGDSVRFTVDKLLTEQLTKLAKESGATLYMVLFAAYSTFLSRLSGQEEVLVGSPIAGRPHADLEPIAGMFVNTLVLRTRPSGWLTFVDYVQQVKQTALAAFEHQDYSFELLVDKVATHRDLRRNPLFDAMFVLQNMELQQLQTTEFRLKETTYTHQVSKFDLTLTVTQKQDELDCTFEYSTALFQRDTIERWAGHFMTLVQSVTLHPRVTLDSAKLMSDQDKETIIEQFNDTAAEFPQGVSVHQLFEEQAARTSERLAVIHEHAQLTYRELNERANRLAWTLRQKGIGANDVVGVCAERSPHMLTGILAILKAGGAYVPMTPDLPEGRLAYMLADSGAKLVLTERRLAEKLGSEALDILCLDEESSYADDSSNLPETASGVNEGALAFIIYTSGSTGQPKGVMVGHASVVNLLYALQSEYPLLPEDRFLLKTTFTFDVSVPELFGGFLTGAALVILPDGQEKDPEAIAHTIREHNVTHINFVPSMLRAFLQMQPGGSMSGLKYVFAAGEALAPDLVQSFYRQMDGAELINIYGPTEGTVYATGERLRADTSMVRVPIGRPLANVRAYVIDAAGNLQPVGIAGELCLAGAGLARGYVNQPELTAEKFTQSLVTGERMYRTGDLVRWLPDGSIEYLGRMDHQVKIRGYRIELGEIEAALLQLEAVREATVIDREEDGERILCAYITASRELTVSGLRAELSQSLPSYMIPAAFVQLEQFPLTTSGKIDRKALPAPDESSLNTGVTYAAPETPLQAELAVIWQDVLGVKQVGIHDNFFDLGGHSLKATLLVSRMHKQLDIQVPLRDVFRYPTIEALAAAMQEMQASAYTAIKPAEPRDTYPVTSQQKRLYVLQQLEGAETSYNMPAVLEVQGSMDRQRFEQALNALVARHEALRTSFELVDGEAVQRIHPTVELLVRYMQASETEVAEQIAGFVRAFDISQAPLMRVGLMTITEDRHILLFDMHHIISDGMTLNLLISDWLRLYEGQTLSPLKLQYKDYACWQQELVEQGALQKQEAYWLEQLSGELPLLDVPVDHARPSIRSFEGDSVRFTVDKLLTEQLTKLAKESGATLYMVLLAAYSAFLSRLSGQEEIMVGSPIAGRPHADLEPIAGIFMNTLVLRTRPEKQLTFADYLQEVKQTAMSAFEHQDYPFELLVDKVAAHRELSRNPLFDVMLMLQNMGNQRIETKDFRKSLVEYNHPVSKFDLTLIAVETDEGLDCTFEYCTALFRRDTIERWVGHWTRLLQCVALTPTIQLSSINILSEQERLQLLWQFNDTEVDYPRERLLQQLLEEQAERSPDRIAVIFEERQLTYRQLNEEANRLARTLRDRGIGRDCTVGMLMDRSPEMLAGIIAILKAGGAYVPIMPDLPEERIAYILSDSGAKLVLTERHLADKLDGAAVEILFIEDKANYQEDGSNLTLAVGTDGTSLAYIIYTSGSTGLPKGVMIEHTSVVNFLLALQAEYPLQSEERFMSRSTYTFDVSIPELFIGFLEGAALVIQPEGKEKNPEALAQAISLHQVTHIQFVPSMLKAFLQSGEFLEQLSTLKYVFNVGEAIKSELVREFYSLLPGVKLVNLYGPTEATIYATTEWLSPTLSGANIPIGQPLNNMRAYVLDSAQMLQPIGIAGELCLAGVGVARGYFNRVELTAEKFIVDPFKPEERMYRTGDLARWLPDGTLEYMGRMDYQVKVRGYRIELGEIESKLLAFENINEAVVMARDGEDGESYLCAYVTSDDELAGHGLRAALVRVLPHYMVPTYFVQMEKMPLTANGKTDRKALPAPEDNSLSIGLTYEAPATPLQEQLAEIWQDILEIRPVGIHDNFFDLGGHSLKATQLISRIHKQLDIQVPLRDLFRHSTIKELAIAMGDMQKHVYAEIPVAERRDVYPVTSQQKRLYVLQQLGDGETNYNMPAVMEVHGRLDRSRFEHALSDLAARHEALRTSFELVEEEVVQWIHPMAELNVMYSQASKEEAVERISTFVQPFDLRQAPLLRVGLISVAEDKHLLLFDMHHIISDGITLNILIRDWMKLYEGMELPALRLQYKDYACWQQELLNQETMNKQEAYWLDQLSGELPQLELPADYTRPAVRGSKGDRVRFTLDSVLTKQLHTLSLETETTLYMVLLAAFSAFLSRISGQEEINVGSPVGGRPVEDLEPIAGMFVNTLVLRTRPASRLTFADYVRSVKQTALAAFEHQDYPFELLVDKVSTYRDLSRNPLFDVMFVLQNINMQELQTEDFFMKEAAYRHEIAKFDLTLAAVEIQNGIDFTLEYSTDLFHRETVERWAQWLTRLLRTVTAEPDLALSDIDLIDEDERNQILEQFVVKKADYPREETLSGLFEACVAEGPERIAVVGESSRLTYGELNRRANQLARKLREEGVGKDVRVALLMERSPEMLVGILAVLKAGGAYVPIDPDYPLERIRYIVGDSSAAVLLSDRALSADEQEGLLSEQQLVRLVTTADSDLAARSGENLPAVHGPDSLAYVLYTSGTTGVPKGVMIEHRNVVQLLLNDQLLFAFGAEDVWSVFHAYGFDFSVWEMYGALLYGGRCVIVPKAVAQSPAAFLELLIAEGVTVLNQTPTAFYGLIREACEGSKGLQQPKLAVRYVIFGGEALQPQMLKPWKAAYPEITLVNMYGITETTVHVTYKEITEAEMAVKQSVIGLPLPTVTGYVMDSARRLVPIGVAGELYVGGDGVARGYLNRDELTEERFVTNPYRPQERLYRSGDLMKRRADGELEYLGRIDHQVKIRGHRIEIGEVEHRLLSHLFVQEATVLAQELQGQTELCAYVVLREDVTIGELRTHMQEGLPAYMVPSHYIRLEQIPLTVNGKIDRKALPAPDGSNLTTGVTYAAPETPLQAELADIWQDVLGVKQVGIHDNFFDLGGHSLKATLLVSRMHKQLDILVPLRDVFRYPTIEALAAAMQEMQAVAYLAIKPAKPRDTYPVTSQQKRLYVLQQLEGAETSYNMPAVLEVQGSIDRQRFEQALNALVARHDALRTSFELVDGEAVQRIHPTVELSVRYMQASEAEAAEQIAGFVRAFDISQAPLMRVGLMTLTEDRHLLLFDMHHIISDGMTLNVLIGDWLRLYEGQTLSPLKLQYKDYACWQQELAEQGALQKQEAYWLEQLSGELPLLDIPVDHARPSIRSFEGDSVRFTVDKLLTEQLTKLAKESGATLYMVLLAAYSAFLSRLSGQEEMLVGSPIAGRPHADLEPIAGMFVNTLVLRTRPSGQLTFVDYVEQVKQTALAAFEHQDYPFERIVEKVATIRDVSRNPLFDAMFVLQNMEQQHLQTAEFRLNEMDYRHQVSKFDLTLTVTQRQDELECIFEYSKALFQGETIERWVGHFMNLMQSVTIYPSLTLDSAKLMSDQDKEQVTQQFNDTAAGNPQNKTIHQLFEEQAERSPEAVALLFEDTEITYAELNRRADKLAHRLRLEGMGKGDFVGVLMERSPHMVIATLGILKAGAAYVPLDSALPQARLVRVLSAVQMRGLVTVTTQSDLAWQLVQASALETVITLDAQQDVGIEPERSAVDEWTVQPDDVAYTIFTSGSTGTPKGVVVTHRPVINLIHWLNESYAISPADRILFITSLSFDLSVYDMFGMLAAGGSIRIVEDKDVRDPQRLLQMMHEEPITIWDSAPAALAQLEPFFAQRGTMPDESNLRLVLLSGDWIPLTLPVRLQRTFPGVQIIGMGGATEATIWSNYYEIGEIDPAWTSIPYGRPIHNARYYILDAQLEPVPIGVPGDLYIGGECLAEGYIGDEELTARKFTVDPFSSRSGARMYHTGDRARWKSDGQMEFLGRIDHQVKIRGYRIELGEIQAALLKHPEIQAAVAVVRESEAGQKTICAYVIAERELAVAELREFLASELPGYMIPSYFMRLESLSVTANGKLDAKALPAPPSEVNTGAAYEEPRNETEAKLSQIWQDVLRMERVGIHDPFFHLGGDSIKAIQVIYRLSNEGMKLEIRDFFQYPTIAQLSLHVKAEAVAAEQGTIEGEVALTAIQMWFFEQYGREAHFNQALMLHSRERLEEAALRRTFEQLIRHHDALRLVFSASGQIHRGADEPSMELHRFDFRGTSHVNERIEAEASQLQSGMNLAEGPLVRLGLFHTDQGDHLLIVIHHLLIDGVSWRILLEDFASVYRQALSGEELRLGAKTHPYRDWSIGLHRYAQSAELLKEKAYWRQLESRPVEALPKDVQLVERSGRPSETVRINWSAEMTEKLVKETGKAYNTDMDVTLLTALALAMEAWTGRKEVLVQLEGHGREAIMPELNVSRTVGWFTSMYPVRLEMHGSDNLGYQIKSVKESLRQVPNKGTGYGLLKYLTPPELKEDLNFTLQPQISFNYLGQLELDEEAANNGWKVSELSAGSTVNPDAPMPFAFNINASIQSNQLEMSIEYNSQEYEQSSISKLAELFSLQLAKVMEHCLSQTTIELTPSDLGYSKLGIAELDELLEEIAVGLDDIE